MGFLGWLDKILSGTDGNGGLTPSSKRVLALGSFVLAGIHSFAGQVEMVELFIGAGLFLAGYTTADAFTLRRFYNKSAHKPTEDGASN